MLDYSLSLLIALIQVPTTDTKASTVPQPSTSTSPSTNATSPQSDHPAATIPPNQAEHSRIRPKTNPSTANTSPAQRPNGTAQPFETATKKEESIPSSVHPPQSSAESSATQVPQTAPKPLPSPSVESSQQLKADSAISSTPPTKTAKKPEKKDYPFTLGGKVFFRGEGIVHPGLDESKPGVGRVLQRIQADVEFQSGWLTGFIQAQDSRIWGFEQNPAISEANLDLYQGYLQASTNPPDRNYSAWIRVGRQEIIFGRQRLIGSRPWGHTGRSFNSVRVHGSVGKFEVDLIGSVLQPVRNVKVVDDSQSPPVETSRYYKGRHLSILRLAAHPHRAIEAELLGLYLHDDQDDPQANRRLANAGGRIWGRPVGGLFYDAEANVQFGDNGGKTHEAWAMATQLGYEYLQTSVVPGIYGAFSAASGQSTSSNKSKEFFNFFPTNHGLYGMLDLFGWRNMRDYELGTTLKWTKLIKGNLTYHYFQLQEPSGAWKNAGGALLGVDPLNRDRDLGHELDAMVTLRPWSPLMIQLGYGLFVPVGAGKNLTAPRQVSIQHFAYLWFVATF